MARIVSPVVSQVGLPFVSVETTLPPISPICSAGESGETQPSWMSVTGSANAGDRR